MPSKEVYHNFLERGYAIENSLYNRYDSLASEEDLKHLFETLNSFKDINNKPLVITANAIMANPDFNKIKEHNFKEYFYESFTETLRKYPEHKNSFDLWKTGVKENFFRPQFHGREHLNIILWMNYLRSESSEIDFTFNNKTTYSGSDDYSFMEAYDNRETDLNTHKEVISDGLKIFENTFGFKSKSFIAPCYVWHSDLNKTLKENGVQYLQGTRSQLHPTETHFKYRQVPHYLGEQNSYGQTYLVRNVTFEPSAFQMDWVRYSFAQIETAFRLNKPAIITSHRVNYIGFLDPKNREKNLQLLRELISKVQKKWPDVEFLSSDALGDSMN